MTTKVIDLNAVLRDSFGFDAFRPGQREAVEALLEHRRILCIQPTGYGKSLLYQLPAFILPGITLVVSPLLALMRDQLRHLHERFHIPSGSINTDQSEEENERVRQSARMGELKILFVAPEQLDNLNTLEFLLALNVSLMVVDEAHCISTWGHDFRPSYRQIIRAVHTFQTRIADLHVLGLTATADHKTQADIAQQLADPSGAALTVLRSSMDRPNISLDTTVVGNMGAKLQILDQFLQHTPGGGILYCATREHTETTARFLAERGHEVAAYHAGFPPEEKRRLQRAFIDGRYKAIAATNALGMGIDKPDIRFIVHVDVPGSITAYYQEVGRAGRDGEPAAGLLLFDKQDRKIQEHFIFSSQPSADDFQNVLHHLAADQNGDHPNLSKIKILTGLHPTRVTVILAELAEQGFVEKRLINRKQVYVPLRAAGLPDLGRYQRQLQVRRDELEAMMTYGSGGVACYMQRLRQALGDGEAQICGRCGLCSPKSRQTFEIGGDEAQSWLARKEVILPEVRTNRIGAGLALLDSDLRTPLFVDFMRGRAQGRDGSRREQLSPALLELLNHKLAKLTETHQFVAVAALPSNTWLQREETARHIAQVLNIQNLSALLQWRSPPQQRQGVLLNNDQRKQNVSGLMTVTTSVPGGGALLLLDDYTGSGATLKEAARSLRKQAGFKGALIPLTMARVKWKLGAPGMI